MGKEAFSKRRELLTQKMSRMTKKKIIKTVVWSVVLYGAETWTLKKNEIKRSEALEIGFGGKLRRSSGQKRNPTKKC